MRSLPSFLPSLLLALGLPTFPVVFAQTVDSSAFREDIRPLLAKHCFECHGPDEAESGLRLDLSESALATLESGTQAIVPGDAAKSEIMHRISTGDESVRMPPEGEPLSAKEVQQLKAWIESGAEYTEHWAYVPVTLPSIPTVQESGWITNSIDAFVLSRLESQGLRPAPAADRPTLIKRLYFDLIGLPPHPDEVTRFLEDGDPNAYEKLVDQLLQSEHFGERWGRHWLDKARYADSDGYEKDRPRMNAWRYRDWVIEAINKDMPFDQFSTEQLAGDLLPNPTTHQLLATAFHRQTLTNTEGGTDQEEFRVEATFDRTETTSAIWMALTMTCARCHNHKYDQISQEEYYQLFAFFNQTAETEIEIESSSTALAAYQKAQTAHQQQLEALQSDYESVLKDLAPQIDAWIADISAAIDLESSAAHAPEYQPLTYVQGKAFSEAYIKQLDDGSLLVAGKNVDRDEYTLVFELPSESLAGIRLEVLSDATLPSDGPGLAPNGNFVLTQLRAYRSATDAFEKYQRVDLSNAKASFSQKKFPPENALEQNGTSGWAISPRMGESHEAVFFTPQPIERNHHKYLQIVLDQQYGKKHTLGRFRVSALTQFDALRALPKTVAEAIRIGAKERTQEQQNAISEYFARDDSRAKSIRKRIQDLEKSAPKAPWMSVRTLESAERETRVLHRGDFLQPDRRVDPIGIAVIERTHPLKSRTDGTPPDRLDLAHWLVHPDHPLTARVTVNQVWTHLFGEGLVRTVNDFGVRGDQPTHPELLDWLAWTFPREMNWSRKRLIKTIVMSSTWRQSSVTSPAIREIDPTNRLLGRQNRVRVEGEIVRDLYLSVSGLLSQKIGGPSVFPALPPGVAELSYANNFKWKTSVGGDRYRRGMYTFFKRTSPHPTLISFDCPDSNTSSLVRPSSNTPLQALVTLNNEVFSEAAVAFARRVLLESEGSDEDRLRNAMQICLARTPSLIEIDRFGRLLEQARRYYSDHQEDARKLVEQHSLESVPEQEHAAWVATLRIILNLDEFIVRD